MIYIAIAHFEYKRFILITQFYSPVTSDHIFMTLYLEIGNINMMHLENGEGTAQQISLLIQYSSQRKEMLMLKERSLVVTCPYES